MVTKKSLLTELLTTRDTPFFISAVIENWKNQLPEEWRVSPFITLGLEQWTLEESILKADEEILVLFTAFGNTEFHLNIPLDSIFKIDIPGHFIINFEADLPMAIFKESDLLKEILSSEPKVPDKSDKSVESETTENVGKLEEVVLKDSSLKEFLETNKEGIAHSATRLRLCRPNDTEPSVS